MKEADYTQSNGWKWYYVCAFTSIYYALQMAFACLYRIPGEGHHLAWKV
jgi:hypothetical protein